MTARLTCSALHLTALLTAAVGLPSPRGADAGSVDPPPRADRTRNRDLYVHDPSTIVKWKDRFWLFATGTGVVSRHSQDLVNWEAGPRVFTDSPDWTTNIVPGHKGYFWAPDVIQFTNGFLLYYSVSKWGVNTSAIGLAFNRTLDPTDPDFLWTDGGIVIQSRKQDDFNAIDPCVTFDRDGGLWLAFGSFWSGIKLIRLDPATGKRLAPESPIYSLAHSESIEAPCLYRHDAHYYLFVNWGLCCRGVNSTYNLRVGRSDAITGPYLDKEGIDLLRGGGSLLLGTAGEFIGPGHAGVLTEGGTNWLSCHFYDGRRGGAATLALRRLQWDAQGWPAVSETPPSGK